MTVLRLVDSDVTLSAVPNSDVDNDAMPSVTVESPVVVLVESDANWLTLTASVSLTPAATPVSVRAPWPPVKSTVRPGESAPTVIAPVFASCVTTPTPSESMLVESEVMLDAVAVDNEVNWDMLTASVELTPAASPLSNTPPVAFDIVNTLPLMPPVRK
ncbi:hypothetical protein BGV47_24755 [Burkholderia ubonensis]|nr:hypothetical protein BGV47_24755 [Burkholderia ubonensis]